MESQNLSILIPGISGMIGTALACHWVAAGHTVIGISRNPGAAQHATSAHKTIVAWDAITPEFFQIRRIDAVVNLAGAPMMQKWDKRAKPDILHSRLRSLEHIYAVVRKLPPSRRPAVIINASSVAIYSNQDDAVDEAHEPDLDINFFQSLVWQKLEKRMRELCIPDVRNVIARIGLLIGPHAMMQQMLRWSQFGAGAILGTGKQNISWIAEHDLSRAFNHLIIHPRCNGVYNLVSPKCTTAAALSQSIAASVHRKVHLRLNERLLHLALGELANNFLISARVYPVKLEAENFRWNIPEISEAVRRATWGLQIRRSSSRRTQTRTLLQ